MLVDHIRPFWAIDDSEGWLDLSRSDRDAVFNEDLGSSDEGKFLTNPEEAHTLMALDAVIDIFYGQRVTSSTQDFLLVTG